ncbi:MAG: exodeoxyribonuclease V subunit gamma, partial [Actinomycetota bacterium]|nr:exodeoxyribonuclease V subunit gamma [Actinomycetota bacterium]
MLELHVADDVAPLAAALGRVLAVPLEDPFTPEWVAVPTEGTMRWLRLELARSLGASSPGAGDGVCANVRLASPGALRELVLAAPGPSAPAPGADPWDVDRLVWAVLEAARDAADDERLGPMRVLPAGATWWSRARRVAELFERYATQRPELLLQWRAGRDLDATGRGIAPGDAWQPHLWRLVRALVATPSPAERLPALLDALRSGDLAVDLPQRLAVFGVTALPGGAGFLDLLDALASTRDVRCFLVDPSPVATRRVLDAARGAPVGGIARGEDRSARAVRHPLLASWGRPYRERALLLEEAARLGRAVPRPLLAGSGRREPRTLLERLQDDLAQDRPPDGTFEPDPRDRSVQLHSCHGISRQVEVARDAILHALADDPSLCEGDVLIVCPSLAETAPVVEAVFGAPASEAGAPGAPGGRRADERRAPALSYRVADRSLRETVPVLAALDSVLELVAGRFAASAVSELLALPPVRERFGLDDAALGTLGRWIAATNVRWGLDGAHRARWGLPGELASGTWREALDRLLLGVAVGDGELELAAGSVAPVGVEGPDVELAGRFADILACLHELSDETSVAHRPQAWSAILSRAVDDLLAAPAGERWQLDAAHELLGRLGEEALVAGRPTTVELTLGDVRRALAHRLSGSPRRPDFFRGGITVSSLTPLRGLPFRVVCVVGLDDSGTAELVDGDDLVAATPRVGDRDPRGESRQALLDAVLAARDLLVVTRTGRDERTNLPVPPCVAYAELRDTVAATARARHDPTHRVDDLEVVHPRQAFDERCLQPGLLGTDGPWSFDPAALRA